MKKTKQVLKFVITLAACFGVSGIGALFTTVDSITNWYAQLQKPEITPANWVFGPVWTILYLLMAISAFLIWRKGLNYTNVKHALGWFLIQLILNAVWTPLFFGLHLILLAFIEIVLLWLTILATLLTFRRVSSLASVLLIPYVIWVGFAAILNGSIWYLNQ